MATVGDVGIGVAAEETEFALWNVRVRLWLVILVVRLRRRWQSSVGTRIQKADLLEEAGNVIVIC